MGRRQVAPHPPVVQEERARRSLILELLRSRGDNDKADQADQELPDNVDPERDSGLLSKFGVDPSELLGGLGGKIPGL